MTILRRFWIIVGWVERSVRLCRSRTPAGKQAIAERAEGKGNPTKSDERWVSFHPAPKQVTTQPTNFRIFSYPLQYWVG